MKRKITIKYKGKEVVKVINMGDAFHYAVSQKHHSQIFRDKTKYTRKEKHKKRYE